jgi:hypothetical protein
MHPDNKFIINLSCVVLTTNLSLNKKYVLSLNADNITLPNFSITQEYLKSNLDHQIVKFLKEYIFVSDIELLPQLISLHSPNLPQNEDGIINTVYGFLVNQTNSLNNCFWVEFDYLQPTPHTELLIEVIQKLK